MENLVNILKSGKLYPNYCSEDLSTAEYPDTILGIPQVCFCDIPVSMADSFMENYGKYAIGFKKQWGKKNKCNPIQYVQNDNIINSALYFSKLVDKHRDELTSEEINSNIINGIIDNKAKYYMLGFIKKYKGEWKGREYNNYNENEWRYIVEEGKNNILWKWSEKEYKTWRGQSCKPAATEALKEMGLSFSFEDINHIIIMEEKRIPKFIKKLRKAREKNELKIQDENFELLLSKITSFERIKNDY